MTREEAIYELKNAAWLGTDHSIARTEEAVEMAIQALSKEPTSEKELNKAYTFGHNRGVKAYYNEQLCTVELPEAVFEYILSLVPTDKEPCDDAISRDAAINMLDEMIKDRQVYFGHHGDIEWSCGFSTFKFYVEQLPSVTQKSVIEDIRTEIKELPYQRLFGKVSNFSLLDVVLEIIDKHIKEQTE